MTKTKKFFKYFITTFKEGKYLLLKYIVSALLMTVIAVLSNLLQVRELTYLNAVLAVDYITTVFGSSIFSGINVLTNQNISSKYRVRKYARIGFKIAVVTILVVVLIFVTFPQFFMNTLTSFIPQDYTFYYIMCGYAFVCGVKDYLINLLKGLEIFKAQFFCECLTIVLTIVGFLVLYFAGVYYLNYIAIAYLVSNLIGVVLCFYFIRYNKTIGVNLFRKQPVQLTAKQWKIIIANISAEVVWEVGYLATSSFLLRLGDDLLNTYSYVETVLDIFNGFLFTYINLTCIKITRSLGRDNFEKAEWHAKNSISGSILIWAFYAIVSMIFIYPISLGANDAYFDIMFIVIPFYVLLHLVRFLRWNLASYMLRLGGKNRPIVIMEVIYALMYVVLCFVAEFIPHNIFLAYVLVAIPETFALIYCLVVYKRKKWMANINDDPNLLKNKVKCFVFDFDDTLYYGVNWTVWDKFATNFFNEHFSYLTPKQRKKYLKKYKCGKDAEGVLEYIERISNDIEGTCQPWLDYTAGIVAPEAYNGKKVPMKELKKCAKQGKLYIVSNSDRHFIENMCKSYKIDLSIFEDVVSNEFLPNDESKERYYRQIMQENGLKPDEVLVVGNSKKSDILPAKKLGMNTYQCDQGFTYEEIVG